MPQIKVRGVEPAILHQLSSQLIAELAQTVGCPKDDFTLELIGSTFIQEGREVMGYPFIEVGWFNRGQDVQDQVAQLISTHFNHAGIASVDIIFTHYEKHNYYENGKHF